jgi:F-type H+-transporting ATPase subunit epsilon
MSNKLLNVEIVSPEKVVYKGHATEVTVPGTKGEFQILFDHTPIFSTTEIGEVKILNEKNHEEYFAVSNGYVEVSGNVVSIVVELAQEAALISEDEVYARLGKLNAELANATKSEKLILAKQIRFEEAKLKVISYNK